MILFEDPRFFILLLAAVIPALVLGIMEKTSKYYALAVSIMFIWLAAGAGRMMLVYLSAFCVLEYAVLRLWLKIIEKQGRSGRLYVVFLILAMAPLVLSKLSGQFHLNVFGFIGISYMTFKILQMVIEIYDGIIKKIPVFDYFSFLLFFPSVLSGPIDRSRRYGEDLARVRSRKDYLEMAGSGIFQIMTGALYKFVLAAAIYQALLWVGEKPGFINALIYMYSYGFYLFFDFAGYSRMAIGTAYIFGVEMPQNFNAPFKSRDIKDFWDRWHITLSHWFRDYLFSRIMMRWIRNKRFNSRLTAASCAFMINMTVMGLWHGLDIYYIIYGLYHGMLLAVTEIWQKKSLFYKKHKKDKSFIAVETVITFNLVMFGLFIFSGHFTEIIGLTHHAAAAGGHSFVMKHLHDLLLHTIH